MNEIRQNVVTRQWVIHAPARQQRPLEFEKHTARENKLPEVDRGCPFCPGNENQLLGIIAELPGAGQYKWQTRVVPNKYPALSQDAEVAGRQQTVYVSLEAYGAHEVVIESPWHNKDIGTMSVEEVGKVIDTCQRRYNKLLETDEKILCAVVFRNHGKRAGTSLIHPHSQIVAPAVVPRYIADRQQAAEEYFRANRRCVMCDMLEYEQARQERIVLKNDSFAALAPYAAEVPCEVWIAPLRHSADFGSITPEQTGDLAAILRDILHRIYDRLDDPDYNYVIHSCTKTYRDESYLHWYLQIKPRLTIPAGFEIGSGMHINPSTPEQDAAFLRE